MNLFKRLWHNNEFHQQLEDLRPRLIRLAYSWCHNAALAEDLVQETLIKAIRNADQLRDQTLLSNWLFSILANALRDHYRQQRDMDDIDELEDFRYSHEITPEFEHAQSEIVMRVRQAAAKLPLAQRQVLTLVDLEEMSYIEVAEILDIPIGTVMSRLCRARQAMKELLKELAPTPNQLPNPIRRVK